MINGRSPGPILDIMGYERSPSNSNLSKAVDRNLILDEKMCIEFMGNQSNLSPMVRYQRNKSVFGVNLVYIKAKEEASEGTSTINRSPRFNHQARSVLKQRYHEPFNANTAKNKPIFGGGFHSRQQSYQATKTEQDGIRLVYAAKPIMNMEAEKMVPETPFADILPSSLIVNELYSPIPTGPPTVKLNEFKEAIDKGNLCLLKQLGIVLEPEDV